MQTSATIPGTNLQLLLATVLRYTVFKERYQKKWQPVLPFRPQTLFAECNECFTVKEAIKREKDCAAHSNMFTAVGIFSAMLPQDVCAKFGLVREYKAHLQAVGLDRDLEAYFQSLQPTKSNKPTLFIQVDGMDQSKWSLPRFPGNRGSKDLQKFIRPRLKLVGCWCSGYLLALYVVDSNYAHDAALTIEAR